MQEHEVDSEDGIQKTVYMYVICSRKGEVHLNQTNQKKCEGRLKCPFSLFSIER